MMRFQHDDAGVMRWPVVLSTLVVIVVVIAGLTGVARLTSAIRGHLVSRAEPSAVREDVSQIEALTFARETAAERNMREQRTHLKSYGWVNRERGIVHVPVDVAMRLYLEEQRKQP